MANKELHIGRGLYLPIDAVTQTFGIIARKGAGKTYTATKMAEEMHGADAQIVALDPVGIWYGLRLGADGKSPGISIPVLGGDHGDIPLEHTAGALVADMIMDTGTSAVVDVSLFRKGQRKVFVADFAEQLFQRAKRERLPMHLFLEEAQTFAPQKPGKGEERMLGAMEDIVRLGRNYGLGASMISQRPQSINKEVLNQTEALLVMQLNGPHERKAINEWVVDKAVDVADMMKELPALEVGTGFLWSPQWLRKLEKVHINKKRTFDASATPKVGQKRIKPKQLTPVDLEGLQNAMAESIEKIKANDPKELQRQIVMLQRDLQKAKTETKVEQVEVEVIKPQQVEKITAAIIKLEGLQEAMQREHQMWGIQLGVMNEDLKELVQALKVVTTPKAPAQPGRPGPVVRRGPGPQPEKRNAATLSAEPADGLSRPQQNIINALSTYEQLGVVSTTRPAVAALAGASPKSSAFTNNLGRLRTLGLLDYPQSNYLQLTDAGRTSVVDPIVITSLADLHAAWFGILDNPKSRILSAVLETYPESLSREGVALSAGASSTSSAFTNNLGRLRTLGVIDYPSNGYVVATALMFPKGLG